MPRLLAHFTVTLFIVFCILAGRADAAGIQSLVNSLGTGGFTDTGRIVEQLAATGDPAVVPVLEALLAGELYTRKSDKLVFRAEKSGKQLVLFDPVTGETGGEVDKRAAKKIKVNNKLRQLIRRAQSR